MAKFVVYDPENYEWIATKTGQRIHTSLKSVQACCKSYASEGLDACAYADEDLDEKYMVFELVGEIVAKAKRSTPPPLEINYVPVVKKSK